jgi:hypothetical protein
MEKVEHRTCLVVSAARPSTTERLLTHHCTRGLVVDVEVPPAKRSTSIASTIADWSAAMIEPVSPYAPIAAHSRSTLSYSASS